VEQFGWGTVVGIILGAIGVYGYALFMHLPGSRAADTPAKKVMLHGIVKSHENLFEIGVLAIRGGPFQPDGSYSIEVPESERYLVVSWYPDYSKFKMQDMSADKSGTLQPLVFPAADVAELDVPVKNQGNGASNDHASTHIKGSGAKDGALTAKDGAVIAKEGAVNAKNTIPGGSR
jgi:hypothetical protein